MSRGRYFQYLNNDDIPIPKSTIWNKRKRNHVDHEIEIDINHENIIEDYRQR